MITLHQLASGALRLGRDVLAVRRAPPPRDASFTAGGRLIPGWLYGPPNDAPAVLLLHTAFGLTVHERAMALVLAREGFACMVIRYAGRTAGTVLQDPERRAGIELVVEAALGRLNARTEEGERRVAVMGFSLGGHFAVHLATGGGVRPAAVVAYYGIYPVTEALIPSLRAPLLIVQGERDRPTLVESARAAERIARPHGRECELALYPDAGHQFDLFQSRGSAARQAWLRTVGFLRRHLGA